MDKNILKVISVGASVVGAVITIAGSIASTKLQDLELDEKVQQAVEKMSK